MILCCGEALVDMLPRHLPGGEDVFMPVAGGAVFNTAIAIGRLGAPAGFVSGLSSDGFGDLLRETLVASNVDVARTITSDRPTTLAFVRLEDGDAQYEFHDENSAGRMIVVEDLPALDDTIEALFFGGISLVSEPCGATYEALARREAAGRLVMLDPNIRPAFVRDERAYRARLDRMIRLADIVKLSSEDLLWLRGSGEVDAQARSLVARGPGLVILTRGGEAASGYMRDRRIDVETPRVVVADTIGAGDTFNAGVLTALHERRLLSKTAISSLGPDDLLAALDLGVSAASVTVSRPGADPPWRNQIARPAESNVVAAAQGAEE